MRTPFFAVPVLVATVLLLTACDPTAPPDGDPDTSPAPTAGPTRTPDPVETAAPIAEEAEDEEPPITRILLRTELVSFGDELDWGLDGFRYDDDPAQALAKLTAAFGAEPETTGGDDGLARAHDWGGFQLFYSLTPSGALDEHGMGVRVTAASVHDITVETVEGVAVGQPMRDAASRASGTDTWGPVIEARFDVVADGAIETFVGAYGALDGSGPVTELNAPLRGGSL